MVLEPLLVFLPMIIFIGLITSYEDLKKGKIRNKWVLTGLIYAAILNILIIPYLIYVSGQNPRAGYFIELAVNVVISLLIGFIMWWIGLWTSGDAKLFTAFAALVPLTVYKYGYVPYFPSSNILINTFVPFFLVYAVYIMFKTSMKQKIHYLKKSLEPTILLYLFLFLFGFLWPVQLFFRFTGIQGNFFFSILFLFVLLTISERLFKGKLIYILIIVCVARILYDDTVFTASSFYMLLFVFLSFIFLRYFILYMGFDFMTKFVDIGLLRPGMVPAQSVYVHKNRYKRQDILHFSLLSYLQEKTKPHEYLIEPSAEGLTTENVKKIKNLKDKLGFEHVRIYKTMSFAPYLFIGTILTILVEGNLFIALYIM